MVSPGAIQLAARHPLLGIIYDGLIYMFGILAYVEPGNLAEVPGRQDLARPLLLSSHSSGTLYTAS